jgi:NitT/TauT family transport system substrate-binding protein
VNRPFSRRSMLRAGGAAAVVASGGLIASQAFSMAV